MAVIRGVHHIALLVRDIESAITLFSRLFGVQFEYRGQACRERWEVAYFRAGPTLIELVQPWRSREEEQSLQSSAAVIHHVAFLTDSIRDAVRVLQERGVAVTEGPMKSEVGEWLLATLDPEPLRGFRIQLAQPLADDSRVRQEEQERG